MHELFVCCYALAKPEKALYFRYCFLHSSTVEFNRFFLENQHRFLVALLFNGNAENLEILQHAVNSLDALIHHHLIAYDGDLQGRRCSRHNTHAFQMYRMIPNSFTQYAYTTHDRLTIQSDTSESNKTLKLHMCHTRTITTEHQNVKLMRNTHPALMWTPNHCIFLFLCRIFATQFSNVGARDHPTIPRAGGRRRKRNPERSETIVSADIWSSEAPSVIYPSS